MTQQPYYSAYEPPQKKKKVPTWVWVVLISLLVVGLIVALGAAVAKQAAGGSAGVPADTDYAAVLYVEGTMTESAPVSGIYGSTYDQDHETEKESHHSVCSFSFSLRYFSAVRKTAADALRVIL